MLAIEGFHERLFECRVSCVTDGHADPRDGLQNGPMPAYRDDKRERNQGLANLRSHC